MLEYFNGRLVQINSGSQSVCYNFEIVAYFVQVLVAFEEAPKKIQYIFDKFIEIIDRSGDPLNLIIKVMWTENFRQMSRGPAQSYFNT